MTWPVLLATIPMRGACEMNHCCRRQAGNGTVTYWWSNSTSPPWRWTQRNSASYDVDLPGALAYASGALCESCRSGLQCKCGSVAQGCRDVVRGAATHVPGSLGKGNSRTN